MINRMFCTKITQKRGFISSLDFARDDKKHYAFRPKNSIANQTTSPMRSLLTSR